MPRPSRTIPATLAAACFVALGVLVPAAPSAAGGAPVLFVMTSDDELDADPASDLADLSLREAFELAGDDGEASSIVLEAGTTYELDVCGPADAQEDQNVDGDLDHAPPTQQALTVFGHGATIRQTCPGERVLHHRPSAELTLLALTVTGGDAAGSGGGIRVDGSGGRLMTDDVTIGGNRAAGTGGGIDSTGVQTALVDTTGAPNHAGDVGGGVHSPGSTALRVSQTTISHNTAAMAGGGLLAAGPELLHSTIVANRVLPVEGAAFGANVFTNGGADLRASIIALGVGAEDCASFGANESFGGNVSSDASCAGGDGDVILLRPQLGPLADHGGPTATHRPALGSPALDLIPFADCTEPSDQRDAPRPRPAGGSCDAGSVEEPPAPCAPATFPDVGTSHPFFGDVCWMDQMAITTGFPDGGFRPAAPVTRQSMAAFLYRFQLSPPFEAPSSPTFTDVGLGHPFRAEVEWLAQAGIAEGFADGTYRPSAPVTRQAMAAFLFRLGGDPSHAAPPSSGFADVSTAHPFFREVHWTTEVGVSTGFADGTWRPSVPITRQAMSAFLHRLSAVPVPVAV